MTESEHDDLEYVEEEISCEEVDRVLEQLGLLMEGVESDTILEYLDETYNQIFSLVYEVEEEGDEEVAGIEDELEDFDDEDPHTEAA